MIIKLRKLSTSVNPRVPTFKKEDYKPGQNNGEVSVPVDYEVEGWIDQLPEVGESLVVFRSKRNGIPAPGVLRTSKLKFVIEEGPNRYFLETQNSIYEMDVINDG